MNIPHDGSVLLVDDEPAIRKMLKMYLERKGIGVIPASSAEEAFELLRREGSRVRVLITDIVMPGISGRDLAVRLRQLRPSLPILFMSGYAGDSPECPDGIPCIRKPLDLKELFDAISNIEEYSCASC